MKEEEVKKTETTSVKTTETETKAKKVEATPQRSFSLYSYMKKAVIVLMLIKVSMYVHNQVYKPKDPEKTYYPNALALGSPFEIKLSLVDRYKKNQRIIFNSNENPYTYDFSTSFNVTLTETEFSHVQYIHVNSQVKFKNRISGKTEVRDCNVAIDETLTEKKADALAMGDRIDKNSYGAETPHLRTKLYFHLVVDENERSQDEDPILDYMYFNRRERNAQYYLPFFDCSQYWVLRRDKKPIKYLNTTDNQIEITFSNDWWYRFTWVKNFDIAEKQTDSVFHDSSAFDEIKNIFSDNSVSYLILLFSVNFLHSLFSFLSVKNKLSFWNSVENNEGLSTRQYYTDLIFQVIIILYLLDNEASIVLIVVSCVEALLSLYIALKILKFERRPDGRFPYYQLQQHQRSELEEETAKYDRKATTFMTMLLMPFLIAYTVYSFYYRGNRDLYSFILKTLVSFIYAIGFINMTPQIFINYKFKSVEKLPWKGMIYKFLNTIIDDLFAFAVKMPTLQRISVFRDDLIFVIYLYQYWIYRNNKGRYSKEKIE